MSLTGILLGLINIVIVVVILLIIGAIIMWIAGLFGFPVPVMVQKLYMALVALIALYMIAALLLGIPTWKVVQHQSAPIGAYIPPVPDITTGTR